MKRNRGGNQNGIATIDSKKVSTQEFMNYLNRLNLNEDQIKRLPQTDLLDNILSELLYYFITRGCSLILFLSLGHLTSFALYL